jgi:pimeloyl-ACP methyl ester carboxylesterase
MLIKPESPTAAIVLLEGGWGGLKLGSLFGKVYINAKKNKVGFLVRNRDFFAKQGLIVALADAPSDMKDIELYRANSKYAEDIKAIASYLKNEANIPVWLVGMSGGTYSASLGAVHIREGIDGLVLFSSVTRCIEGCPKYPALASITDMDLSKIIVPTVIVYHKNDQCVETPPSDAQKVKAALINAPKIEVMFFEGGKKPKTGPCAPLSAHGYYGIDEEVITEVAEYIKSSSQ